MVILRLYILVVTLLIYLFTFKLYLFLIQIKKFNRTISHYLFHCFFSFSRKKYNFGMSSPKNNGLAHSDGKQKAELLNDQLINSVFTKIGHDLMPYSSTKLLTNSKPYTPHK